jgi:hypothetical protein
MSHAILLFASTFAVVFLLGLQQLLVHGRRYRLAFLNSVLIGLSQLALFKIVPHQTTLVEIACYLSGGPLGIIAAMWFHDHIANRYRKGD